MSASLPVAVGQLQADTDMQANARNAAAVIAAADPARLIVLPEYTSGWARDLTPELAEEPDGAFATAIRQAAADAGRAVVAGAMQTAGDKAANVALALSDTGDIAGRYRKVHLFDAYGITESDALAPGDPGAGNVLAFDIGDFRFGVATCYDLRFPETFRVLADAGANVFAIGAAWVAGEGKVDLLVTLARARAIENTSYVLLACQSGPGRSGNSVIIDPRGVVLARGGDDDPETLHATLRADLIAEVREQVPSLRHRRYRVVPD